MKGAALKLGTASWMEGAKERRALVAELPSDASRLVDLNRVEQFRLSRLGEGAPETLAEVLVPASLRRVLEGGSRALQRVRQTLAYAEKWHQRGDLPEALAMPARNTCLLPCLPRPALLRRLDGSHLDRLRVQGPGATLGVLPQPTLAIAGGHRSGATGWCLAIEDLTGVVLGAWMLFEAPVEGSMDLACGSAHRRIPMDSWADMDLPEPRPGEIVLLPAPRLKALAGLVPGANFSIKAPFETLCLKLGAEATHGTVQ